MLIYSFSISTHILKSPISTLFSSFKCIKMVVSETSNAARHNKETLGFQNFFCGII